MFNYQAYLMRLQRNPDRTGWHASLENVETGEVLRFSSVQNLLAHISEMTSSVTTQSTLTKEEAQTSAGGN
jgi:hypothetical protein